MKYLQTKICIVGGGPAGATTSLFLSHYGIEHILVDKANFPRDKVCGESFDGRVYRILEELSPRFLIDLQDQGLLMKTWNYGFRSKKIQLSVAFPSSNLPRLSLTRVELDHYLAEQVAKSNQVQVLHGYAIQEVFAQEDHMCLIGNGLQIDAELVIMANGAQPLAGFDRSLFVFSRTYYELSGPAGKQGLEVYYFDQPVKGCLFLCPLSQGRYNVEIGVQQADYKAGGMNMAELLQAYLDSSPDLQKRFAAGNPLGKARGISMLLRSKMRWSEPGMIYAGASAFCVNPITGLGVGNAMSMGKLAAQLIRDHIDRPDLARQVTRKYRKAVRHKFRTILWLNRLVNFIHRHFGFFEPLLAVMLQGRTIRNLLMKNDLVKAWQWPVFGKKNFRVP